MNQDQRTPFQRPETWDARKDNYEQTTEALTGLFVEQVLDAASTCVVELRCIGNGRICP